MKDLPVFDGKRLSSNSRGIRGKREYAYSRQPSTTRILALGDSYTFGDEVSDHETYSSYLESSIPESEVLNLGISGYGHDQMLIDLREEGVKYKPDIVLLGFVWFDVFRNLWNFNTYAKPKFVLRDHKLILTHVPVPSPDTILREEIYRP